MRTSILILILLNLVGCANNSYEEIHKSPSGKLTVKIYVGDRLDKNDKYNLTFRLVNNNSIEYDYLNTRASDIMKWAFVWYNDDIIILDSHDVGTQAWAITENRFQQIPVTKEMFELGEKAFKEKYSNAH